MKSQSIILAIAAFIFSFILGGCTSTPSHLIIAPEIMTSSVTQHVDQQAVQNGSTVNGNQVMNVAYQVNVDAADVGQIADWVLVASYAPGPNEPAQLFVRNAEQWHSWNGQMDSLPAAMMSAELQQQQSVQVFEGSLNDMPGRYSIYVGYRLNDNRLVYNQNPLVFSVNP